MKIKSIKARGFRRFAELTITDLPPAKLIILAGPNGTGKSSLFGCIPIWHQSRSGFGIDWDGGYHLRDEPGGAYREVIEIGLHDFAAPTKKSFYVRSAYRNDPTFKFHRCSVKLIPQNKFASAK